MPFELPKRELMWQRQMEEFRELIKKDPYEALFGTSDRRLGTFFPKFGLDSSSFPFGRYESRIFKMMDGYKSMLMQSQYGCQPSATPGEQKLEGKRTEETSSNTANEPTAPQEQKPSTIHGHTVWSASGLSGSQSFSASGELEFDPITMRMVPKTARVSGEQEPPKVSQIQSKPEITAAEPVHQTVDIPVKKYAGSGTGALSTRHADILKQASIENDSGSTTKARTDQAFKERSSEDKYIQRIVKIPGGLDPQSPYDILRTKHMLEQSWMRDRQSRKIAELELGIETTKKKIADLEARHVNSEGERSTANNVAREPISTVMPSQYWNVEGKKAYISMFRKDKPLKHMSYNELNSHKTNLLAYLDSRQTKKTETPADQKLNEEIKVQKMAMAAFENKWAPPKSAPPEPSPSGVRIPTLNSVTTGGITLPSLAAKYNLSVSARNTANTDEYYKTEAPYATTLEDQSENGRAFAKIEIYGYTPPSEFEYISNRKLVKDVRQIYENAYGTIDVNHKQGKLEESIQEYDRKVGPLASNFTQGDDVGTVEPTAPSSTRCKSDNELEASLLEYERKIGPSLYNVMHGGDARMAESTTETPPAPASDKMTATTPTLKASETTSAVQSRRCLERRNLRREQRALKAERREQRRMKQKETTANRLDKNSDSKTLAEQSTDPNLYRLLAYDPSDQSIHTASASSSFKLPKAKSMKLFPVPLSRLHNPAKFLPHLAKHQADGYEIFSATKNLLILKRVRYVTDSPSTMTPSIPVVASQSTPAEQQAKRKGVRYRECETSSETRVNPVDGTTNPPCPPVPTTQTGNFASPTGFVNHDVFTNPPAPLRPRPSSESPRVRREEPVFSGTSKNRDAWQWKIPAGVGRHANEHGASTTPPRITGSAKTWTDYRAASLKKKSQQRDDRERETQQGGFTRSARQLLLIGGWTAACCYATGVMVEYFRTGPGGADGTGSAGGSGTQSFVRRSWGDVASAVTGGGAAAGAGKRATEARIAREDERGEGIARAMLAGVSTAVVTATVLAWLGWMIGTDA